MDKYPKIFTDEEIVMFLERISQMANLDATIVVQEMLRLEEHYRGNILNGENEQTLLYIKDRINFKRVSLGSMYQSKQKLTHTNLAESEYLTRLVCNELIDEVISADSDDHYRDLLHLIQLLECVYIHEIKESYYKNVIHIAEKPSLSKILIDLPDVQAGVYFCRVMLGVSDRAQKYFDLYEVITNKGPLSFIYRFLYYCRQGEKTKALEDLQYLKKNYNESSRLETAFELGQLHKVLTLEAVAELRRAL